MPNDSSISVTPRLAISIRTPQGEAIVQRSRPVRRCAPPPRADDDLVDAHYQGLSGPAAANLDRTDQRVPCVQHVVSWLEELARFGSPARAEAREGDRVVHVDREDRFEVAREVAVERAPLERDLVERHHGTATRSRNPW